jgi:hypothetical protein
MTSSLASASPRGQLASNRPQDKFTSAHGAIELDLARIVRHAEANPTFGLVCFSLID